jgi:ribosomal protein S18 acetylase RimI-like enzyme
VHDSAFTPKWAGGAYLPVVRTPGYAIERELVVVAPDGRFTAFLVYWLDPLSRSGLFEPVGCHSDFRRRGLTTALLYEGMRRMVAQGMRTAIVNHHTDNLAAAALYRSVGFQTVYAITDYRKLMA